VIFINKLGGASEKENEVIEETSIYKTVTLGSGNKDNQIKNVFSQPTEMNED
jgi:hypothetical protein